MSLSTASMTGVAFRDAPHTSMQNFSNSGLIDFVQLSPFSTEIEAPNTQFNPGWKEQVPIEKNNTIVVEFDPVCEVGTAVPKAIFQKNVSSSPSSLSLETPNLSARDVAHNFISAKHAPHETQNQQDNRHLEARVIALEDMFAGAHQGLLSHQNTLNTVVESQNSTLSKLSDMSDGLLDHKEVLESCINHTAGSKNSQIDKLQSEVKQIKKTQALMHDGLVSQKEKIAKFGTVQSQMHEGLVNQRSFMTDVQKKMSSQENALSRICSTQKEQTSKHDDALAAIANMHTGLNSHQKGIRNINQQISHLEKSVMSKSNLKGLSDQVASVVQAQKKTGENIYTLKKALGEHGDKIKKTEKFVHTHTETLATHDKKFNAMDTGLRSHRKMLSSLDVGLRNHKQHFLGMKNL